jgi:hypothetical protein
VLTRLAMVFLAATATLAAAPHEARAGCYEDVGCTHNQRMSERALRRLNCGNLWFLRNSIYADNGYCFKTDQAISAFGNDGCRYRDQGLVPLNAYERYNVGLIRKVERRKGC